MNGDASLPTVVDWDAAIDRERRRDPLAMLPLAVGEAGGILLHWPSPDRAPWVALAAGMTTLAVLVGVRRVWTDPHRIRIAVREHVDPGPRLRTRTHRYAEVGSSRVYWLLLLNLVSVLLRARWGEPVQALAGAVLLTAAVVAIVVRWRRLSAVADRWLEDPPVPPAERAAISRPSGQRELAIFVVGAGVVLAALFLVALLTG